jgi:hypothetical protein
MQPRHFKRLGIGLIAFFLCWGFSRLYYHLTDDFRLANMTYAIPFETNWQSPILTNQEHQQIAQILNQPFYYHRKGAQCYVFISQDQHYVLKFFKFKHLRPHLLAHLIPPFPPFRDYKQTLDERKKNKLLRVFDGFDLAYQENREGSGLIYLQLTPLSLLHQNVTVVDKMGMERFIDLDTVPFLIQSKGETLRTRLKRQLNARQVPEAQRSIASILDMYLVEYQKGLLDGDPGVMHNTGFLADRPFRLDVGKLSRHLQIHQVEFYKKNLEHIIWKIDQWIKIIYPTNYSEMTLFLSKEYERLTGEFLDIASIDSTRFEKKQ